MLRSRRVTTVFLACWLILTFAASTAQARQGHSPQFAATPAAAEGDGWRIVGIQVLDERITPVALSPDGQWIAGIDEEDRFCVWDAATLEPACDAGELPIHLESITWAPDSAAVAWSLDAFRTFEESDIFVFEMETGTSVNLTDDGIEGMLGGPGGAVPLDVLPAWSADSQSLTFARSEWTPEQHQTELMTIARAGGEPEPRHTVATDASLSISTPMYSLANGSLLYAVTWDEPKRGIWLLEANGATRQVLPGATTPVIVDVVESGNGTLISAYSQSPASEFAPDDPFTLVLEHESGDVTPLVHPDDAAILLQPAGFSPDGSSTISVALGRRGFELVALGPETSVTLLPEPVGIAHGTLGLRAAPEWVGNTILVSGFAPGSYLVTVEPAP
ncbi:hypothetical protein BH20CHL3_BH20CHL3_01570 [soil metagenome]